MGESASEAVIHTVARQTDRDPLELPPLFDVVDPDALDALVRQMRRGDVTFEYAGQTVTVDCDGQTVTVDCTTGVRSGHSS